MADYRDSTGRRHRLAKPSLREAREMEDEGRREARRGRTANPLNPTLAEYAESWLEGKRAFLKPDTLRSYAQNLNTHLLPAFGGWHLRDIGRRDIKEVLGRKLTEGLERSTVLTILAVLRAVLSDAREDEILVGNPAAALGRQLRLQDVGREAPERVRAMDRGQLERFLAAARDALTFPLFAVMVKTGLRLGEALGVQWGDLDLEAREAKITRAWGHMRAEHSPKSGHGRTIDLSPGVVALLRSHKTRLAERALAEGREFSAWVFPSPQGRPWTHEVVRRDFGRAIRRAGLQHFSPHDLRHTYASMLIADGVSLAYVQSQLGHAKITMTADLYGNWLRRRAPEAAGILDGTVGTRPEAQAVAAEGAAGESSIRGWSQGQDETDHQPAQTPVKTGESLDGE
jgi:integrase